MADKHEFELAGQVEVREGAIRLGEGQPQTGIVLAREPIRNNYELSLEAMRTSGSDFFCGITFPIRDDYCTLIIGGWGGDIVGLSNVNGMAAVENETTMSRQFENNRWYKVRLRVTDEKVEVWLDDEQVIDLEAAGKKFDIWWQQQPMRPLGIATWHTGSALRRIEQRRVKGPGDQ